MVNSPMRRMSTRHNARHGFSLIELLVVILIIGLLMALLLPTLSQTREKTRRLICQVNLKQWVQVSENYATDFRDAYPGVHVGSSPDIFLGYYSRMDGTEATYDLNPQTHASYDPATQAALQADAYGQPTSSRHMEEYGMFPGITICPSRTDLAESPIPQLSAMHSTRLRFSNPVRDNGFDSDGNPLPGDFRNAVHSRGKPGEWTGTDGADGNLHGLGTGGHTDYFSFMGWGAATTTLHESVGSAVGWQSNAKHVIARSTGHRVRWDASGWPSNGWSDLVATYKRGPVWNRSIERHTKTIMAMDRHWVFPSAHRYWDNVNASVTVAGKTVNRPWRNGFVSNHLSRSAYEISGGLNSTDPDELAKFLPYYQARLAEGANAIFRDGSVAWMPYDMNEALNEFKRVGFTTRLDVRFGFVYAPFEPNDGLNGARHVIFTDKKHSNHMLGTYANIPSVGEDKNR